MTKTRNKTGGKAKAPTQHVPVKEGWEHDLDIDDYKINYLVLLHCPKKLETKLRNSERWDEMERN